MNKKLHIRRADFDDIEVLSKWDTEPHVIKATTDSDDAKLAFDDKHDWSDELRSQNEYSKYYMALVGSIPIGAMQIIDPHNEPTHYWGKIEPNLRAIDIWIGEKDFLGKGFGSQMMTWAIDHCFSETKVTAIVIDPLFSNQRAHHFYQRLGFEPLERKVFLEEDDCLVHRLEKQKWETLKKAPVTD